MHAGGRKLQGKLYWETVLIRIIPICLERSRRIKPAPEHRSQPEHLRARHCSHNLSQQWQLGSTAVMATTTVTLTATATTAPPVNYCHDVVSPRRELQKVRPAVVSRIDRFAQHERSLVEPAQLGEAAALQRPALGGQYQLAPTSTD